MTKTMLDTDILSEVLKRKNPHVLRRAAECLREEGRLTTSSITVFEVVSGLLRKDMLKRHEDFLSAITKHEVLALDQTCAEKAGEIEAKLLASGQPIGPTDVLIAAIALTNDMLLVSGNTDHYTRIKDLGFPLKLDNWRIPQTGTP